MSPNTSYSNDKLNQYQQSIDAYAEHLKNCANILYRLETDDTLSLQERNNLKVELGNILNDAKTENQLLLNDLTTEFHAYEATSPRSTLNLSAFQMLKEKVVSKDKNYQLSDDEAADDSAFYYRDN
ncbi:hypothetical protein L6D11_13985 [Staphylococcus aureus]|nr:hypothetical protein [Staphylococcus aureus]